MFPQASIHSPLNVGDVLRLRNHRVGFFSNSFAGREDFVWRAIHSLIDGSHCRTRGGNLLSDGENLLID